jgi:hypothetical protein
MAELSEYEKWLLGVKPESGRTASSYDVNVPNAPISIGGYRIESRDPEFAPEDSQMFRASYELGNEDYYVSPGVQRRESPYGPSTGSLFAAGINPLGVVLSDMRTPEGRYTTKGVSLGPLSYSRVTPNRGKPTGVVSGSINLDPEVREPEQQRRLNFEGSKQQQSVGYSTPLDLGVLELLAMRDPEALSAFLRYKLNF